MNKAAMESIKEIDEEIEATKSSFREGDGVVRDLNALSKIEKLQYAIGLIEDAYEVKRADANEIAEAIVENIDILDHDNFKILAKGYLELREKGQMNSMREAIDGRKQTIKSTAIKIKGNRPKGFTDYEYVLLCQAIDFYMKET